MFEFYAREMVGVRCLTLAPAPWPAARTRRSRQRSQRTAGKSDKWIKLFNILKVLLGKWSFLLSPWTFWPTSWGLSWFLGAIGARLTSRSTLLTPQWPPNPRSCTFRVLRRSRKWLFIFFRKEETLANGKSRNLLLWPLLLLLESPPPKVRKKQGLAHEKIDNFQFDKLL